MQKSNQDSPITLELDSLRAFNNEKALHILHVDDEISFLQVSKCIMESENNFKVDMASSVNEALKKIAVQSYDVIVSDYEMPQLDGLHFLKEMRELRIQIPFILFTGKSREEIAVKALNLGAEGYYCKQGSPETVYSELAHGIRAAAKHKQIQNKVYFAANLFDAVVDSILVHDFDGKIVFFNEEAHKLRGYSKEEFQELKVPDLEVPGFAGNFKLRMKRLVEKGDGIFEALSLRKDKVIVPLEIHARLIDLDDKKMVLSIDRDISERKNAEGKIEEFEEKYLAAFESSTDALMLLDDTRFLDCNASALRMFNFASVEEFTKKHLADLSPPTQPDGSSSKESVLKHIRRTFWMGKESFVWENMRADGTTFPAEVLLSRMRLNNRIVVLATVRDITERIKTEEKLKEDFKKMEVMNEKLRVVGGLTRHDVRNKLSVVNGYAYLLKKNHKDQADVVNALGKMEQAVREIIDIFNFAKIYEQIGMQELSYINVEEELKEAVALFSEPLPRILNECHGLKLLADSLLRQIFFNFIDNTKRHGKKSEIIRINYKEKKDSLKLVYQDDGVGIPKAYKSQLFKEGFSSGGSSGYGLFLINKMIKVYGWEIQEIGEHDKGVHFVITIPKIGKSGKRGFQIESENVSP
jgi:PAS domain S-box-containing protein